MTIFHFLLIALNQRSHTHYLPCSSSSSNPWSHGRVRVPLPEAPSYQYYEYSPLPRCLPSIFSREEVPPTTYSVCTSSPELALSTIRSGPERKLTPREKACLHGDRTPDPGCQKVARIMPTILLPTGASPISLRRSQSCCGPTCS